MHFTRLAVIVFASAAFTAGALAQGGPVATGCANDIAKFCSGKPHDGSVRICLETNYTKVSAACKQALDSTGGGRGKQLGRGKGK
jgi:hypothetical protein